MGPGLELHENFVASKVVQITEWFRKESQHSIIWRASGLAESFKILFLINNEAMLTVIGVALKATAISRRSFKFAASPVKKTVN